MDALTALHTRNSVGALTSPGPDEAQLDNIIQAGLRACDHGWLRPWKYLIIEGDARLKFGNLMACVKEKIDGQPLSDDNAEKLRQKGLRAPMIIAVVAKVITHPKIPEVEQLMSAAASAQMMMTAAHAQGLGAIWRSGALMYDDSMRDGLGLDKSDQLAGFLYIGTPKATKALVSHQSTDYINYWPAK